MLGSLLTVTALTPPKISNVTETKPASAAPPPVIYVTLFSTDAAENQTDDSDQDRPHLFGILGRRREKQQDDAFAKLPAILQKSLVESLNKGVARAAAGDGLLATQVKCWVVRGEFVVVDPGGRALQAGIGFGAGQSHVEVRAQVYSLEDPDNAFLVFDTKGASGHMPGAVVMMNPYVVAAKFVMAKKEPEKEAKKIGQQIAKEIARFMTAQGIPTLQALPESGHAPAPVSDTPSPVYSSKGTEP
ncbi:MAG: DUF4410 domain-containing protein [Methylacidiphilales bacterium]|nr:DUF4410 domain-containing protein [Candidatus Methylacidiphilales bacterium]